MTNRYLLLGAVVVVGCTSSPYYDLKTGESIGPFDNVPDGQMVCGPPGDKRAAGFSFFNCDTDSDYTDTPFGETLAVGARASVFIDNPSGAGVSARSLDGTILKVTSSTRLTERLLRADVEATGAGTVALQLRDSAGSVVDSADVPVAVADHVSSNVPDSVALVDWVTLPVCAWVYSADHQPLIASMASTATGDVRIEDDPSGCTKKSLFGKSYRLTLSSGEGTASFAAGGAVTISSLARGSYSDITDVSLVQYTNYLTSEVEIQASMSAGGTPVIGADCDYQLSGLSMRQVQSSGAATIYHLSRIAAGADGRSFTCSLDGGRVTKTIQVW